MLERSRGLPPATLAAIADLEARVLAADGGRLKLEYGVLRSRAPDEINDVLWWDGERLLGFVGAYAFGPPDVEIAGMVDPGARRRGVASALIDAVRPVIADRGYDRTLVVTPRNGAGGREFADSLGAEFAHSEHALVLVGEPTDGRTDPAITTRPAELRDVDALGRLLAAAFGDAPSDLADRMALDGPSTVIIERDHTVVGTLRLSRDDELGGVYGFAVDPRWQGQGIGRDVLRRACRELRADGADRVGLEVAIDNEHALGLYTSLGFRPVLTEDYFALPPG